MQRRLTLLRGVRLKARMGVAEAMRRKLIAAFEPDEIALDDESARHAGHAGARPGGETHFRLYIVSAAFAGMSRVDRQRRIHDVLRDELRDRVHALSIDARTPEEMAAQAATR